MLLLTTFFMGNGVSFLNLTINKAANNLLKSLSRFSLKQKILIKLVRRRNLYWL